MITQAIVSFLAPSAPSNLVAFNVNSTGLNVTWNVPLKFNGVLTQYTVYYKLVEDDNNETITDKPWVLRTVTTNQTTEMLYGLGKFY